MVTNEEWSSRIEDIFSKNKRDRQAKQSYQNKEWEEKLASIFRKSKQKTGGNVGATNHFNALNSRESVERAYEELSGVLNDALCQIANLNVPSEQVRSLQSDYSERLSRMVKECKDQLEKTLKNAVWDKLVIAFVGVTNAGKSTIIETFRILFDEEERRNALMMCPSGVDGDIIGDGSPDFTKVYKEYNMTIKGRPFVLIDVPGIEGDESSVSDEIRKALGKAHCVFYVQGEGKKPDAKTVEKIKDYLKDWVKVYSIFNVRGTAFNYDEEDERQLFKTKNVLDIESQIHDTFKDSLGDKYAGNITIQARLALCSEAKFSSKHTELIKEQTELISYFSNSHSLYEFSNFAELTEKVEYMSNHFGDEIAYAQNSKLYKIAVIDYNEIFTINAEYKHVIVELNKQLKVFKKNCLSHFDSFSSSVEGEFRNEIVEMFDALEKDGCSIIDLDLDEKDLSNALTDRQNELMSVVENNFQIIISNELVDLTDHLERERERLKESVQMFNVNYGSYSLNLNVELRDVLGSFDFGFSDLLKWGNYFGACFGVGYAIAAGANWWNPVGWAIAAVGALVWIFGDSKADKAKKKYREEVSKARNHFFSFDFHSLIEKLESEVDEKKKQLKDDVDLLINGTKEFEDSIVMVENRLNNKVYKFNQQ